jgi:TRAP-type C4-dicarboxylate transport system permease small subunit
MTRRVCAHFEEITGGALLVVLCCAATLQVVWRYLFANPLAWTEEFATIVFAWVVFLGASLALKQRDHFVIEAAIGLLPRAPRRLARRLAVALVLLVALGLVVFGVRLCWFNAQVLTPVLGISRAWMYAAVPAGGLLMALRCLPQLREPEPPTPSHSNEAPAQTGDERPERTNISSQVKESGEGRPA